MFSKNLYPYKLQGVALNGSSFLHCV